MSGDHERAVRRDLRRVPREGRSGALANLALELARALDSREGDAGLRDLAAVSAQYHAVLRTLAGMAEPAAVSSPIDELRRRREEKLA